MSIRNWTLGAAATLTVTCSATWAQTGPSLLMQPWDNQPHWAQTNDEPIFMDAGHTKGDDRQIRIMYYDSVGRIKFEHDNSQPVFTLGYQVLTMDISTDHPNLPSGLTDISLAGALRLGELAPDWSLSILAGAGTANDNHFDNSDALYALGAVHVAHKLTDKQQLHMGISYDGNRTFLPDVPLPYITFVHALSKELSYGVGVPASFIRWQPVEPLTLEMTYLVPVNVKGTITLQIIPQWLAIFTEYGRESHGFHRQGDIDTRRIFYDMNKVSAGLKVSLGALGDLRVGAGYAFDQRFSTGFDTRNTNTVALPSDEVFFFFSLQGKF